MQAPQDKPKLTFAQTNQGDASQPHRLGPVSFEKSWITPPPRPCCLRMYINMRPDSPGLHISCPKGKEQFGNKKSQTQMPVWARQKRNQPRLTSLGAKNSYPAYKVRPAKLRLYIREGQEGSKSRAKLREPGGVPRRLPHRPASPQPHC